MEVKQYLIIISSPPSAAYMRQWTGSALVQVMGCRLFGAKPLPEPWMLAYCQLTPENKILVKIESEFHHFHSRKCIWNCRLPKWWPLCLAYRYQQCQVEYCCTHPCQINVFITFSMTLLFTHNTFTNTLCVDHTMSWNKSCSKVIHKGVHLIDIHIEAETK